MPTTISDSKALDLWNEYAADTHGELDKMPDEAEKDGIALIRAAYAAGRGDALIPLDPLAYLKPGTVLRDVTVEGYGAVGDAFILDGINGPHVGTAHGFYPLSALTTFTTDDRTTRYTRLGGIWTAENLNGETDD